MTATLASSALSLAPPTSEAMIIASVLAENTGPPGYLTMLSVADIKALVARRLTRSHAETINWRQRVPVGLWPCVWDMACAAACRAYGDAIPDVHSLPDVYGLPRKQAPR